MPFLPWNEIDTVLLDMDGTLLDLHYDNQFWLHHLPKRIAQIRGISEQQSKDEMMSHYSKVSGQIQWYCLDYWAQTLQLDLMPLKRELAHLIEIRPDTIVFLDALHQSGREVVLVTNAHPSSLALKIECTQLNDHIDTLISTHEFGVTKESQKLWHELRGRLNFTPERTLFVDDSVPILKAAQQFGIKHLLAVDNPDSKLPHRNITEFPAVTDYRLLLDDILSHPIGPTHE